jgi:hypothetical protein
MFPWSSHALSISCGEDCHTNIPRSGRCPPVLQAIRDSSLQAISRGPPTSTARAIRDHTCMRRLRREKNDKPRTDIRNEDAAAILRKLVPFIRHAVTRIISRVSTNRRKSNSIFRITYRGNSQPRVQPCESKTTYGGCCNPVLSLWSVKIWVHVIHTGIITHAVLRAICF